MSALVYERISATGHDGRRVTHRVRVWSESGRFVTAEVVNLEGEKLDKLWIIDKAAITARVPLTMNLHYGRLEPTREAPTTA